MRNLSDKVFSTEEDKNNKEWFEKMVIGKLDHYLNNANILFIDDKNSKAKEENKSVNLIK